MVDFPEAVKLFYKRYSDFKGRSSRSEYWWVILWQFIVALVIFIPAYPWLYENLDAFDVGGGYSDVPAMAMVSFIVAGVMFLGHIIPIIALDVRRWHDLGRSGWFFLLFAVLGVIPVVGSITDIVNLVWFCFKGNDGQNQYGPDPLGGGIDEIFD